MRIARRGDVARPLDTVHSAKSQRLVRREYAINFFLCPNVERALSFLDCVRFRQAVGVLCRVKTTVGRGQVAQDIIQGFPNRSFELRIRCRLKRLGIGHHKLRLVIQHFFEMRHVPSVVYRITMETAAQMIIHSAASHLLECELHHVERVPFFIPPPISKQEIEHGWTRKFWSRSESALFGIVTGCQLTIAVFEPIKLQRA